MSARQLEKQQQVLLAGTAEFFSCYRVDSCLLPSLEAIRIVATRLIPLTQVPLYVVSEGGRAWGASIRSAKRWGADARWRSSRKNFPMSRAALLSFLHDAGRTGSFVPRAEKDALWP